MIDPLFVYFLALVFVLPIQTSAQDEPLPSNCYTEINGHFWRLVFEDHFLSGSELGTFWDVKNETTKCSAPENDPRFPNYFCPVAQNARIDQNFLVLSTQKKRYLNESYIGAILTSRQYFSYGRYEIRATQAVGRLLRTRIITRNTAESSWAIGGQINIGTNLNEGSIFSDVLFKSATEDVPQLSEGAQFEISKLAEDTNEYFREFHTYGMEWNDKGVTFFLDENYQEFIPFNESYGLLPWRQIQLHMGVGGLAYEKILANVNENDWQCPVFVIDYIRVYEQVNSTDGISEKCTLPEKDYRRSLLDGFCEQALGVTLWAKVPWKTVIIIGFILLVLLLIGFLLVQIRSMRKQIISDQSQMSVFNVSGKQNTMGHTYDELEIYENVYDYPKDNEYGEPNEKQYQPMQSAISKNQTDETHNEYIAPKENGKQANIEDEGYVQIAQGRQPNLDNEYIAIFNGEKVTNVV